MKILQAYGFPKETVTAIIMLNKDTKALVRSPDGDKDFFDVEAGDTLASYLLIIYLHYVL